LVGSWKQPRGDPAGREDAATVREGEGIKGPGPPSPETTTPAVEPLVRSPATGGRSVALRGVYPPRTESIQSIWSTVQITGIRTPRMCTDRPNTHLLRRSRSGGCCTDRL